MTLPLIGNLGAFLLALCRRPDRPVAVALGALAILDAAKLYAHPIAPWVRLDAALWMLWPLPAAALAAWAWRSRPRLTAAAFALYPALTLLRRWPWVTHPRAWTTALWAPHVAGLLVAGVAWWRWKDEGPGPCESEPPSVMQGPAGTQGARPILSAARSNAAASTIPTPSSALAQQVAGILALSSAVDLLVGAGAPGVGYEYAAPLAWVTWAAIGWVLVRRREPSSI